MTWIVLTQDSSPFLALAGLDPVDGTGGPLGGEERVLDGPVPFSLPSLIIGTGLGPQSAGIGGACAPEGDNHEQFYASSQTPSWHVVVSAYGHNDMLNDETPGCGMQCTLCPAGPDREGMRTVSAGLLVSHFASNLQGALQMTDYLTQPDSAPVSIETHSK